MIDSEKPDIILLDLIMPNKNGFELLSELKLDPRERKVPVIVLSNLGQASDIEKAKELGADDYLIKADMPLKDLSEKVKYHLVKSKK